MHYQVTTLSLLILGSFSCSALGTVPSSLGPPNLLDNGEFEIHSSGLPTSWDYAQGDGSSSLASTMAVSPFDNLYPLGNSSILMTDGPSPFFPDLRQEFSPSTYELLFSFDFQLVGAPNGSDPSWNVYPRASFGAVPFNVSFDAVGGSHRLTVSGASDALQVLFEPDEWYSLQIRVDPGSQTTSGEFLDRQGLLASWTELGFSNPAASDVGGIVISDLSAAQNNSVYFDNVSLRPIPEPPSGGLLCLLSFAYSASRVGRSGWFRYAS